MSEGKVNGSNRTAIMRAQRGSPVRTTCLCPDIQTCRQRGWNSLRREALFARNCLALVVWVIEGAGCVTCAQHG